MIGTQDMIGKLGGGWDRTRGTPACRLRDIEFLEQLWDFILQLWAFILNGYWVYLAVGIGLAVLIGARGKRRDPDEDKPPHIYW